MPKRIYDQSIDIKDRRKYSNTRAQARMRNEEWAFTLESWLEMWTASNVYEHRGNKPHQYCMVRLDTIEAWGPHNCVIVPRRTLLKKNAYENLLAWPKSDWQPRHGVKMEPWDTQN